MARVWVSTALEWIYFYSARVPYGGTSTHVRGRNASATSFYDWITHLCRPINTAHCRYFRADGAGNECYGPDFGLVWLGVLAVSIEAGYSARKLQKLKINGS